MRTTIRSFWLPIAQLTSTEAKNGHMDTSEPFFRNFSILLPYERKGEKRPLIRPSVLEWLATPGSQAPWPGAFGAIGGTTWNLSRGNMPNNSLSYDGLLMLQFTPIQSQNALDKKLNVNRSAAFFPVSYHSIWKGRSQKCFLLKAIAWPPGPQLADGRGGAFNAFVSSVMFNIGS
jgi:hypothetical protein